MRASGKSTAARNGGRRNQQQTLFYRRGSSPQPQQRKQLTSSLSYQTQRVSYENPEKRWGPGTWGFRHITHRVGSGRTGRFSSRRRAGGCVQRKTHRSVPLPYIGNGNALAIHRCPASRHACRMASGPDQPRELKTNGTAFCCSGGFDCLKAAGPDAKSLAQDRRRAFSAGW